MRKFVTVTLMNKRDSSQTLPHQALPAHHRLLMMAELPMHLIYHTKHRYLLCACGQRLPCTSIHELQL
jgi:hypothetical protein